MDYNYCVGRIASMETIDELINTKALEFRSEVGCYTEHEFIMFGGEPENVTLELDDDLIGVIYVVL